MALSLQVTNTTSNTLFIDDLDSGRESSKRKHQKYIAAGDTVTLPFTSKAHFSYEQGTIRGFIDLGYMTATLLGGPVAPDSFDNATRPAATAYPAGAMIWNTDDNAPNYSDGTDWRDADGTLT